MRRVRVTGGFSDYVVGVLTEKNEESIVLSDIRVALIGENDPLPELGSGEWLEPSVPVEFEETYRARVSLLVDDTTPPGTYYLWATPIDNPTATPVKAGNHLIVVV